MVDWNGLAEIAPVLAAGFTGKPNILQNTIQASEIGKKNRDDQALRSFGRELFSLGHPPDEMEVQTLASKYGLDPFQVQALVKTYIDEKRNNKLLQLKEQEGGREERKVDILEKEADRKAGMADLDTLAKQLGILKSKRDLESPRAPVPGTPEALKWEREKAQVAQEGRMTNMPPWFDSYALEKLGEGIKDPQKMSELRAYLTTPQGQSEVAAYRKKYASENATPLILGTPTAEGLAALNARTGEIIQTGEKGRMPSEMVVAEQQIGTLKETLNRVKDNFRDDFVGPVGGRYGQLKGEWVGLPQEQAEFYADVAQINNTLIYLMSGKQINEQEYERLKKQLPNPNLPPETFVARMEVFEKTLDSIMAERSKNIGGYKDTGIQSQYPKTQSMVQQKQTQPKGQPSQSDLEFTAKKYGITVEEVKKRLGIQ